jgi:hypothetical protein
MCVTIAVILKVLQLFVVTTSENPINRFTNPNPRLSHCATRDTIFILGLREKNKYFSCIQSYIKIIMFKRNPVDKVTNKTVLYVGYNLQTVEVSQHFYNLSLNKAVF